MKLISKGDELEKLALLVRYLILLLARLPYVNFFSKTPVLDVSQPALTCSTLTTETLEQVYPLF